MISITRPLNEDSEEHTESPKSFLVNKIGLKLDGNAGIFGFGAGSGSGVTFGGLGILPILLAIIITVKMKPKIKNIINKPKATLSLLGILNFI